LINSNTRNNTKRRQIGGGKPGPEAQAGIPYKANSLLKGREIVRRDYPRPRPSEAARARRRPARKHSSNGRSQVARR
jgi:hypothetical protein